MQPQQENSHPLNKQQPNNQQVRNIEKANKTEEEKLRERIIELEAQNKKLKTRLIQFQPQKQKVLNFRQPNARKVQELFKHFKMKKYALKICYLGFSYDGMAYQVDTQNTIEYYLFKVMHTLSLIPNQTPGDTYTRAGRTDKGVSAMGNVISVKLRSNQPIQQSQLPLASDDQNKQKKKLGKTKPVQYCSMMNAILPDDIRIIACQQVSQQFNARYWCTKRSYKYFFALNNMDIEAMRKGIKYYEGTHNWINFCKMNLANTVNFQRTIFQASIHQCPNSVHKDNQIENMHKIYYFHYVGNSFLWHQIRFMSSILFMIGSHRQQPQIILQLFDIQKHPRKPNYPMAAEYPLILEDCHYEQLQLLPQLKTVLQFNQTFSEIIMKRSVQKTLIQNCIRMAERDLVKGGSITYQLYQQELLTKMKKGRIEGNKAKDNKKMKTISMYKPSGRTLDEAVSSLKGKRLQLFEKKKQKQQQYQKTLKKDCQKGEQKQERSQNQPQRP